VGKLKGIAYLARIYGLVDDMPEGVGFYLGLWLKRPQHQINATLGKVK
jgi:hypothetical protein